MVGWRHQLNGHEFEQAPGDGEGQGRLVWGHKKLDTIQQLNNNNCKTDCVSWVPRLNLLDL